MKLLYYTVILFLQTFASLQRAFSFLHHQFFLKLSCRINNHLIII